VRIRTYPVDRDFESDSAVVVTATLIRFPSALRSHESSSNSLLDLAVFLNSREALASMMLGLAGERGRPAIDPAHRRLSVSEGRFTSLRLPALGGVARQLVD
jgi:hypothetical protein